MTRQDLNKRRALIVRRQAAYRAEQGQELPRRGRRRRTTTDEDDVDEVVGADGLLADLPDGLVG